MKVLETNRVEETQKICQIKKKWAKKALVSRNAHLGDKNYVKTLRTDS